MNPAHHDTDIIMLVRLLFRKTSFSNLGPAPKGGRTDDEVIYVTSTCLQDAQKRPLNVHFTLKVWKIPTSTACTSLHLVISYKL